MIIFIFNDRDEVKCVRKDSGLMLRAGIGQINGRIIVLLVRCQDTVVKLETDG